MKESYSVYEAKSHLSEIIRGVRHGRSVVITDRRRPVARVTAVEPAGGLEARIRLLEERGEIQGDPLANPRRIRAIARRPGALKRFLASRNRY